MLKLFYAAALYLAAVILGAGGAALIAYAVYAAAVYFPAAINAAYPAYYAGGAFTCAAAAVAVSATKRAPSVFTYLAGLTNAAGSVVKARASLAALICALKLGEVNGLTPANLTLIARQLNAAAAYSSQLNAAGGKPAARAYSAAAAAITAANRLGAYHLNGANPRAFNALNLRAEVKAARALYLANAAVNFGENNAAAPNGRRYLNYPRLSYNGGVALRAYAAANAARAAVEVYGAISGGLDINAAPATGGGFTSPAARRYRLKLRAFNAGYAYGNPESNAVNPAAYARREVNAAANTRAAFIAGYRYANPEVNFTANGGARILNAAANAAGYIRGAAFTCALIVSGLIGALYFPEVNALIALAVAVKPAAVNGGNGVTGIGALALTCGVNAIPVNEVKAADLKAGITAAKTAAAEYKALSVSNLTPASKAVYAATATAYAAAALTLTAANNPRVKNIAAAEFYPPAATAAFSCAAVTAANNYGAAGVNAAGYTAAATALYAAAAAYRVAYNGEVNAAYLNAAENYAAAAGNARQLYAPFTLTATGYSAAEVYAAANAIPVNEVKAGLAGILARFTSYARYAGLALAAFTCALYFPEVNGALIAAALPLSAAANARAIKGALAAAGLNPPAATPLNAAANAALIAANGAAAAYAAAANPATANAAAAAAANAAYKAAAAFTANGGAGAARAAAGFKAAAYAFNAAAAAYPPANPINPAGYRRAAKRAANKAAAAAANAANPTLNARVKTPALNAVIATAYAAATAAYSAAAAGN